MTVEITCPTCLFSKMVPEEGIPVGVSWATCPSCKQRFEFELPQPSFDFEYEKEGTEPEKETGRSTSPWEERSELGIWQGIYQTFKTVLFSPKGFYRTIAFQGGLREPLAFGILIGSIGAMFELFVTFLTFLNFLPQVESIFPQFQMGPTSQITLFMFVMVLTPLFVTVNIFISSGVLHLFLFIFGGGHNGFEATFRVVAYTRATQAWSLIPLIGTWINGFWRLVVHLIGLREIHETTYLKAAIAVLVPLGLKIFLIAAILIALFALL